MKSVISILVFFSFCASSFFSCKKKDCPDPSLKNANQSTGSTGTTSSGSGVVMKSILLKPGKEGIDAMVNSIDPNRNYDNYFGYMHAIASTWSSIPGASRIYMRFDYSSIPANAKIQSVRLTLFADTINTTVASQPKGHTVYSGELNGILTNEIFVKRITSDWDEKTITWNKQPFSEYSSRIEMPSTTSRSQTYNIDITKFAIKEIANPNESFGVMIQLADETKYRGVTFRSSDDTTSTYLRPEVVINYTE